MAPASQMGRHHMKKLIARAAAVASALGMIGGASLVMAPAASAYNVYTTGYTTVCIGPDLWNARIERVDFDWWEETFQGKRDYTRLIPTTLSQYRNPWCVQRTYA